MITRSRRTAWIGLIVAVLATAGLPAMHAAVHALEEQDAAPLRHLHVVAVDAPAGGARHFGHAHPAPRRHHGHARAHDHAPPAPPAPHRHHHHAGDAGGPLDHGRSAPEHLGGALFAVVALPVLPAPTVAPAEATSIAPRPIHPIVPRAPRTTRGPPI